MKIDSTLVLLKTDFSTGKVGGRRMHWSEKIAKDIIKRLNTLISGNIETALQRYRNDKHNKLE